MSTLSLSKEDLEEGMGGVVPTMLRQDLQAVALVIISILCVFRERSSFVDYAFSEQFGVECIFWKIM